MNPLNYILKILKKPFPEQESRFGAPKTIFIISAFITFFLYVFQPFGIGDIESSKFLICLGFGLATLFSSVVYEFIVSKLLKLKSEYDEWTFGKWTLYNLGLMLVISLANFLFIRLAFFGYINWEFFPDMVYGTFMVGLIPIIMLGGFSLLVQERKYQNIAQSINQSDNYPEHNTQSKTEQTLFDIPFSEIKYVEALQNYVSITYVDNNAQLKKHVERTTLKKILELVEDSSIIQSHRSFLVNRNDIVSTSGNAQGLKLSLKDCDKSIPVSRSYVAEFK